MKRLFGRNGDEAAMAETAGPEDAGDALPGSDEQSGATPRPQAPSNVRQYSPEADPNPAAPADGGETPTPPLSAPAAQPPVAEGASPAGDDSADEHLGDKEDLALAPDDGHPASEAGTPTGAEAPPDTASSAPAIPVASPDHATQVEAPPSTPDQPLAVGDSVAGRYVVISTLIPEQASALLGAPLDAADAQLYAVEDTRGYERCWSCGSTANAEHQRFCVDCGAQLQHHQLVLARTKDPSGEADEFTEAGSFYHLVLPRKQFGSNGVTLEIGAYSLEGPHKPNEDSYWTAVAGGSFDSVSQMVGVAVLADGMGGYAPGSGLISREVVTIAGRHIFGALLNDLPEDSQESALETVVRDAILEANNKVLAEASVRGEMGSTFVAVVCHGTTAFVANIGDSRAYYIAPSGAVTQITRDQSLVEAQVAAGLVSPEAVYSGIGNNVILHAIGEEGVEDVFDWYIQPLEPGGRLLLCSDGYWKTMRHDVWNPEAAQQQTTLAGLARTLAEDALARNTDDNTTVVLIAIH